MTFYASCAPLGKPRRGAESAVSEDNQLLDMISGSTKTNTDLSLQVPTTEQSCCVLVIKVPGSDGAFGAFERKYGCSRVSVPELRLDVAGQATQAVRVCFGAR